MARDDDVVVKLSDLVDGQEAVCFAALVRKTRGMTRSNQPYIKCVFRDKRVSLESALWHDSRFFKEADSWVEGEAYRLRVLSRYDVRFGMQLDLLGIQPVTDADVALGFDFLDLVPGTEIPADELLKKLRTLIDRSIENPALKTLVETILSENQSLFERMPAAQNVHHSYTSGLLEHVWSMTRVAGFLAEHYARYYHNLDPPLDRGLVVAAVVLHDIGKLRELEYHPVEAKYTTQGHLIGHVLLGRDMVREAARRIEGFPEELLLNLEHAILAHHGKREFGAPVLPQTIEALLVSYIDDLDSKMNVMARERIDSQTDGPFTDRVFALDNRRIYKGVPAAAQAPAPISNGPEGS
jgi:3'-5' exoribonuclease